MTEDGPLVSIRDLSKHFAVRAGLGRRRPPVRAVEGLNLDIASGETVGLVGESGCGKTTAGRMILRLLEATRGEVWFRSRTWQAAGNEGAADVLSATPAQLRLLRRDMQIMFQDPYAALNPRHTLFGNVGEPLRANGVRSRAERRERVAEALDSVGLPRGAMDRYPHEFSGGQRQRAVIARALTLAPSFVVADEAVSALDVSIQAQVLNILMDLQQERGLAFLFIAHDLAVVRYVSHRIAVMYLGRIVELADTQALFARPRHPYTELLISAVPDIERSVHRERASASGDLPDPADPPPGCPFQTRCPYAEAKCREEVPKLREIDRGHRVACHFGESLDLGTA